MVGQLVHRSYLLANIWFWIQIKLIDMLNVLVRISFVIRDFFEELFKLEVDEAMEKETDENSKKIQEMIEFFDNKKKKEEEEEKKK